MVDFDKPVLSVYLMSHITPMDHVVEAVLCHPQLQLEIVQQLSWKDTLALSSACRLLHAGLGQQRRRLLRCVSLVRWRLWRSVTDVQSVTAAQQYMRLRWPGINVAPAVKARSSSSGELLELPFFEAVRRCKRFLAGGDREHVIAHLRGWSYCPDWTVRRRLLRPAVLCIAALRRQPVALESMLFFDIPVAMKLCLYSAKLPLWAHPANPSDHYIAQVSPTSLLHAQQFLPRESMRIKSSVCLQHVGRQRAHMEDINGVLSRLTSPAVCPLDANGNKWREEHSGQAWTYDREVPLHGQ